MSDPSREDVLDKLDALMKRHQPAPDSDIPVLTDIVAQPEIDLDSIPLLTEEIAPPAPIAEGEAPADEVPPLPELEALEFEAAPEAAPEEPLEERPEEPVAPPIPEFALELPGASEASLRMGVEAPALEIEVPPDARYVSLVPSAEEEVAAAAPASEPVPAVPMEPAAPAAPAIHALSEETIQLIADTIKSDVARILDTQLQQALAQQLQNSLHVALDRALSSMLDQFVIHIEEVVKISIASELKKQLAELDKPEQQ